MARIHVIGGGLAGLAAAVECAAAGRAVKLYEAAGQAGGRCRSFYDEKIDAVIDNGNHLLLSGNRAARAYLRRIGAGDRVAGPDRAVFPFIDLETGERWQLRLGDGWLPLWILDPRRRVPGTRAHDYLAALRLLLAGSGRTVTDLLGSHDPLYRRFWEPLVVAALNSPPEKASAELLGAVLRETFLRGGRHCRPLIARESLAHALVDPALHLLRARGAEVRFHARATGLDFAGDRVEAIRFGRERCVLDAGDRVILAVPARIARTLVSGLEVPPEGAAIVNVHYRLPEDGDPTVQIVGLVGGLAEWVFRRGRIVSVTISAADHVVARPASDIAVGCWSDVARALDFGAGGTPPPWRVIKEKRATFAATPESLARRPGVRTRWRNLFLAGDWTATGLPATIESAIRSGHKAAQHAMGRHAGDRRRKGTGHRDGSLAEPGAHKP